jgi:DNA end-binding protein Ku
MPRSMWRGTLTFGLVSVPVKLYSAVINRSVHFHQLHAADHARIYMKRFCPVEDEEVAFEDTVKGYEIAPERYVVVEPHEFAALEPAFTRTIDIEDFVDIEEIDPIYFDQPYLIVPDKGGARSYVLLMESMRKTAKVAIARVVLRSRERLVAIRVRQGALLMTAMNFSDEIQSPQAIRELEDIEGVNVSERELSVAQRLVDSIAEPFDITKYHDNYREALLDLIDRKAAGEEIVVQPSPRREPTATPDLMGALEASLQEARQRRDTQPAGANGAAKKRAVVEAVAGKEATGTEAAGKGVAGKGVAGKGAAGKGAAANGAAKGAGAKGGATAKKTPAKKAPAKKAAATAKAKK